MIPPHLLEKFIIEVAEQCDLATDANTELFLLGPSLELALLEHRYHEVQPLRRKADQHAQAFLTHSANVAKIIWPSKHPDQKSIDRVKRAGEDKVGLLKQIHSARGVAIQQALNIEFDVPKQVLELRNHLEHYDERLEEWFVLTTTGQFLDKRIGLPISWIEDQLPDIDRHRLLSPIDDIYEFWGVPYDLSAMRGEIDRIRKLAGEWLEENTHYGRWLRARGQHR